MVTIYEIIWTPIELIFPIAIIEHALFGLILELTAFIMSWLVLVIIAYIPLLIAYRLTLRGVKKWF